jgi:outer membrane protein TolC
MRQEVRSTQSVTHFSRRTIFSLAILVLTSAALSAQEAIPNMPALVPSPAAEAAVPATPPAPLSLEDCVQLAFEKQPAMAAARASLAAAISGQAALDNLPIYARLCNRDLCIRKEQASLGVTIAQAAVAQAEAETRYAVTRTYFTLLYLRLQSETAKLTLKDLDKGKRLIRELVDAGDPKSKTTKDDLDLNELKFRYVYALQARARAGTDRALAALREAIGVGPDFPLDVAGTLLPSLEDRKNVGQNELSRLADIDVSLTAEVLVQLALNRRGEMVQATSASRVTDLEVDAQATRCFSLKVGTYAGAADLHATPIPQGVANEEYRPGAIPPEMPVVLVGRVHDRVARATDFSQRAGAVVDKTRNLIVVEAENGHQRWREARDKVQHYDLRAIEIADALYSSHEKKVLERIETDKFGGRDLTDSTMQKFEYRAYYLEARFEYALSLAALERITAGGLRIYPAAHPAHP